jgi:hypothetical protein
MNPSIMMAMANQIERERNTERQHLRMRSPARAYSSQRAAVAADGLAARAIAWITMSLVPGFPAVGR